MKPAIKIIVKVVVFAYLLYFGWQIWSAGDFYQFVEVDHLKNVNIIFHEAGHTLFALFGDFLFTLGGSFLQILIPFAFAIYFFIRRIDIYRRFFGNGILYLFGFYKAFNFC